MEKQLDAWPPKTLYLEEEKAWCKAWIAQAQRRITQHQKRVKEINLEIEILKGQETP